MITPEQTSLRGLLVLLREIEHDLALQSSGAISHEEALIRIRELAESSAWADQVQLAKWRGSTSDFKSAKRGPCSAYAGRAGCECQLAVGRLFHNH